MLVSQESRAVEFLNLKLPHVYALEGPHVCPDTSHSRPKYLDAARRAEAMVYFSDFADEAC